MTGTKMTANHRQERRGTTNASVPSLSPLEMLPTETLREIVASDLETSRAVVRSRGGCSRLELNPSILQTSKTMLSKCRESWRGNRLVRVTYKGDACFRPTAFVPVAGNDAYKILAAPYELVRVAFVADLNVAHKVLSSDDNPYIPTVNVCVITVDAACTWLAILSCLQLAEHMYAEESPSFQLDLLVYKKDMISSRVCSNLYQAISLMLDGSTTLSAIRTPRESDQLGSLPKNIWSSPRDAVVFSGSVYGAWISSLAAHEPAISALRPHDARLDHCTYICKILIGLHRLQAGSAIMKSLKPSEQSLVAQRACAALLNWTYEYHRSPQEEGSLARLKESWQIQDEATCMIEGCPCLLWACLDLAEEALVSAMTLKDMASTSYRGSRFTAGPLRFIAGADWLRETSTDLSMRKKICLESRNGCDLTSWREVLRKICSHSRWRHRWVSAVWPTIAVCP